MKYKPEVVSLLVRFSVESGEHFEITFPCTITDRDGHVLDFGTDKYCTEYLRQHTLSVDTAKIINDYLSQ